MGRGITLHSLDQTGLILFAGEDAQSFLQGQVSCDVAALTLDKSAYGSYCTPKGRVLATFLLWRSAQGFFMQLPRALRESIQKRISMFILRAKVKPMDASDTFARFGVAGDEAASLIKEAFGDAPRAAHEVKHLHEATLISLPGERFEVVVPSEKTSAVRESLTRDAQEADHSAWDRLEIRAGIPWITPATQEEFVPQSLNLDLIGGVSFAKGCYPGQEIVARVHYRGQGKQRMYRVNIATEVAPQPGDKLYSADMGEQSTGMLVNAAPAEDGGYDALAVIQTSSVGTGDVHWKTPQGPALRFLSLPYEVR